MHLLLLGIGVSAGTLQDALFLQLPLTGSRAAKPWTRRETVLSMNCLTFGFSFRPPHALCFPKNDSTGSWQNFSLRIYETSGTASRSLQTSTKECTAITNKLCTSTLLANEKYSYLLFLVPPWSVETKAFCSFQQVCIPFYSEHFSPNHLGKPKSHSPTTATNTSYNKEKHFNTYS